MSAFTSDVSRLRPIKKNEGLSTATVYVKGFGSDDGNFGAWLDQHRKLESTRGWRSDAFGYEWPSGNEKKMWLWSALGIGIGAAGFVLRRNPKIALATSILGNFFQPPVAAVAGAVPPSWLWNYKTAEKNAINLAPDLAADIRKLNRDYEKVQVVAHSLGCRLVIEAAARLPQEYLPSQTWLLAPACPKDALRSKIARERAWLYYTERDAMLRYLFPWVSGGKVALGAVGLKGSYPGLTAQDVSDQFGFFVHRKYENRFADLVRQEEEVSPRGQETKVFLPARERFESCPEKPSNAPRVADERAVQRRRRARKKPKVAGLEAAKGQEKRLSDRSAPLPLSKEWLRAQKWGSRKSIEKTTDANAIPVAKTSAATVRQEVKGQEKRLSDRSAPVPLSKEWLRAQKWGSRKSIEKTTDANSIPVAKTSAATVRQEVKGQEKRLSDRSAPVPLSKEWLQKQKWGSRKSIEKTTDANAIPVAKTSATTLRQEAAKRAMDRVAERQGTQRTQVTAVQKTEVRQGKERKVPKKKGWGLVASAALTAAAFALGIPYIG